MGYGSIREVVAELDDALSFVPNWLVGIVVLALAFAVALVAHALIMNLARRALTGRPFLLSLVMQTRGPSRLALVVVALGLVLPAAPFSADAAAWVGAGLRLVFVILLGWIALTAVDVAEDIYLLRFRLDAQDNLLARKHMTQVRVLKRATATLVVVVTIGAALMTFDAVRQYGLSLFASAGVAGIVVGLAARPVLSNLIAGVQLAMTQPIRLDDAVVVENEWGVIEEITMTYVVVRLWDWRRLIVPLTYFIEKPFQNWTRETSEIIGSVLIHADYSAPVDRVREKLKDIVEASPLWDRRVLNLQVTNASERTIELRALMSARSASDSNDLRCEVREKLIEFLRSEYPHALPHERAELAVIRSRPAQSDGGGSRSAH